MDSFLTLGITVKMQAGIISIPAPLFYNSAEREKSRSLGRKASLHFFSRLTNPLLPYTIRLRTLNLLLYPFLSVALSISSNNPVFSSQTYTLTFTLGIKMLHSIIVQIRDNTSIPPYYLIPFEDILYMNNCLL